MIAARLRNRAASLALALLGMCGLAAMAHAASGMATDSLWKALASGDHVVLLRHAIAPGTGDPGHFTLGDCSTQRNLSQAGREQAASIGRRLRANGIRARVYASQWCRTLETAKLLQVGPVEELPVLNSFFATRDRAQSQTRALQQWLAAQDLSRPLVLVTHQVNITALTEVYPASGEMVILRREQDGTLRLAGTIATE